MGIGVIGAESASLASPVGTNPIPLLSGSTPERQAVVSVSLSPGRYVVQGSGAFSQTDIKFYAPNSKTSATTKAGESTTLVVTSSETELHIASTPKQAIEAFSNAANYYSSQFIYSSGFLYRSADITSDGTLHYVVPYQANSYGHLSRSSLYDSSGGSLEYNNGYGNTTGNNTATTLSVSSITGNMIQGSSSGNMYTSTGKNQSWSGSNNVYGNLYWNQSHYVRKAEENGHPPFIAFGPYSGWQSGIGLWNAGTDTLRPAFVAGHYYGTSYTVQRAYYYDESTGTYHTGGEDGYMYKYVCSTNSLSYQYNNDYNSANRTIASILKLNDGRWLFGATGGYLSLHTDPFQTTVDTWVSGPTLATPVTIAHLEQDANGYVYATISSGETYYIHEDDISATTAPAQWTKFGAVLLPTWRGGESTTYQLNSGGSWSINNDNPYSYLKNEIPYVGINSTLTSYVNRASSMLVLPKGIKYSIYEEL